MFDELITWLFVNIYPSLLIITPEPSAVDVEAFLEKIELTEYSIWIPTIDGKTFCATATPVSEYPVKDTKFVLILVLLSVH